MNTSKPLKIGIAGLGTVGAHVFKLIQKNSDLLAKKGERALVVTAVSSRDQSKDRGIDVSDVTWFENALDLASCDEVDVIVETIGGSDGIAFELAKLSLESGKHFVTANKALIALKGDYLLPIAEQNNVSLAFEAAVAGGIPIVKALREGLAGNEIQAVYGILNGTCNYILSQMWETGADFDCILKDAQDLGYAEADPSFDVDGVDAGHKLSILSALAFEGTPNFDAVNIQGIRKIEAVDIAAAEELGYRIKLLGIAKRTAKGVEQSVEPCMVPVIAPIATVEGSLNAVYVEGNFVGQTLYVGHGAGGGPTASAVVADIIDIARSHNINPFGIEFEQLGHLKIADMRERQGDFYLRLNVIDKPGVIADVTAILRDCNVSIRSVLQHGHAPEQPVPVVLTTHNTTEHDIKTALTEIGQLKSIVEEPFLIRIEKLD